MRYNYDLQQYPQLNASVRSSPQVQVRPAHNAYHNQGSARYQPYRMPQHAGSYLNRGAQYQNGSHYQTQTPPGQSLATAWNTSMRPVTSSSEQNSNEVLQPSSGQAVWPEVSRRVQVPASQGHQTLRLLGLIP